jgi:hypothetical protein
MRTRGISNRWGTQRGSHSKKSYTQNPLEAKAQVDLEKKNYKPLGKKTPSTPPPTLKKKMKINK